MLHQTSVLVISHKLKNIVNFIYGKDKLRAILQIGKYVTPYIIQVWISHKLKIIINRAREREIISCYTKVLFIFYAKKGENPFYYINKLKIIIKHAREREIMSHYTKVLLLFFMQKGRKPPCIALTKKRYKEERDNNTKTLSSNKTKTREP